ncbi:hypothetical protein N1030_10475 [Desulfovibrio mangrovi]|uniref:TolB family protein n=1 Tax=Desulfovibrio mangrovi TaxID=2976983 RepID=UPI002247E0FD|nr:hypothetical protein [Desulfovibrio mangrovi]UZP66047.1 hypothetical protein N1030_10475 [Desulfovibrio mangrovi]
MRISTFLILVMLSGVVILLSAVSPVCAETGGIWAYQGAYSEFSASEAKSFAESIHRSEEPEEVPEQASGAENNAGGRIRLLEPLQGTVFPKDLASPLFWWSVASDKPNAWLLTVSVGDSPVLSLVTSNERWIPESHHWSMIREQAQAVSGGSFSVALSAVGGWDGRTIEQEVSARFSFSEDPVGASVFFLRKPVPFAVGQAHPENTQWLLADVASAGSAAKVMDGLPICGNCHAFSPGGQLLGMDVDVDGDKGGYLLVKTSKDVVVGKGDVISWNNRPTPPPAQYSFGLFTALSYDGRFAASTIGESSLFVSLEDKAFSQLFFPVTGRIGVYDTAAKKHFDLSGANDDRVVQTAPAFSPDGRTLAFSRAPVDDALLQAVLSGQVKGEPSSSSIHALNKKYPIQFDIWTVPFNQGKGGVPEPLKGASGNGKSNYFARYSPDGKWIVFTQSPTGLVLQPRSRLMIVPAGGGEARPLAGNVDGMNSWHSWSPNGRWLVFSGKSRSPETELFLTHVSEEGVASPAIRLFRYSAGGQAVMVPEFVPESCSGLQTVRFGFPLDGSRQVKSGNTR